MYFLAENKSALIQQYIEIHHIDKINCYFLNRSGTYLVPVCFGKVPVVISRICHLNGVIQGQTICLFIYLF